MAYIITVRKNGEVFAETQPIASADLDGILKIMEKPSMFGTQDFQVTITRVLQ